MKSSRRSFIKTAGLAAAGLTAQPAFNVLTGGRARAATNESGEPLVRKADDALTATQWAMVVDTRKLKTHEDLLPLIQVCHKIHNVPKLTDPRHLIMWIWETEFKHAFPEKETHYLHEEAEHMPFPVLCNHCENPPCVRACPTQATFKRDDGIVLMDFHRCIGCRFCMAACPYGARSFNFRDPRPFIPELNREFPTRMRGVVEKCNFCAERLAVGQMPACVEASNGALIFGDLKDPESEVRKVLREHFTIRRKPSLGTEPAVYYII